MEIKNREKFLNWLKDKCKYDYFDFNAYLEDLEKQYFNTGSSIYELSSIESKTGLPEFFYYDVLVVEKDDQFFYTYIF